jgi:Retrotransposon gag protein
MSNHSSISNLADQLQHLTVSDMASRPVSQVGQRQPASSSSGTTSSTTTLHGGTTSQFKMAPPDLYYGDRKKFREFLNQVQLNFMFHPQTVDISVKKIMYAATFLRSAVFDWFEPYMKNQLKNGEDAYAETLQMFQNFSNFKVKLNQIYENTDTVKKAERDLQKLRQKKSASRYTSKFHQLASRVSWKNTVLAAVFYTGLKNSIKNELARINRSDDLQPLIEVAIKVNNRIYERQLKKE